MVASSGSGQREPEAAADQEPEQAADQEPEKAADQEPEQAADQEPGTAEPPNAIGRAVAGVTGVLDAVDRFQRRHRPLAVAVAVVKKFGDDQAGNLAALVAYYAFFSLFPLLLVLVTVLGFVLAGDPELQTRLVDSALSQFPVVGEQLRTNIGEYRGSGLALAIGVVGSLWGGLGALDAMQNAMNAVWNVPKVRRPNLVQTRLRGLIMLAAIAAMIAATTALSAGVAAVGDLGAPGRVLALVPSTALNVTMFVVTFKVLTDVDVDWRVLVPGAAVAGLAFTALQTLGGWYVDRVLTGATHVYGVFAIVLGLLSWLYLQAQVTVLAAEVNVVIHRDLVPRSLTGSSLTAADHEALRHYAQVEERIPEETVHVELPDLDEG